MRLVRCFSLVLCIFMNSLDEYVLAQQKPVFLTTEDDKAFRDIDIVFHVLRSFFYLPPHPRAPPAVQHPNEFSFESPFT